jgi:hypothetical protein
VFLYSIRVTKSYELQNYCHREQMSEDEEIIESYENVSSLNNYDLAPVERVGTKGVCHHEL